MVQIGAGNNEATVYPKTGNEYEMNEIMVTVHESDSAEKMVKTSPGIKPFL